MNKESPKAAAPVPHAGTEQALSGALNQASEKQKPEESSVAETLRDDLISDVMDVVTDVVISIFD